MTLQACSQSTSNAPTPSTVPRLLAPIELDPSQRLATGHGPKTELRGLSGSGVQPTARADVETSCSGDGPLFLFAKGVSVSYV